MNPLEHHSTNCSCTECISHPSHARQGIHVFPDKLYVLTVIENPLRWRSRYWNYWAFERQCEAAGAVLYTAEIAFGDRHHEITDRENRRHLQVRSRHECWHKEDAQNALLAILPPEAQYIACVDADLAFARPDWAQETLHLLQHYHVVQMFSHMVDIGPNYQPVRPGPALGFVYLRHKESEKEVSAEYAGRGSWGCPGGAWAYRRSTLDTLGGLLDWMVVGSGDWYMAKALYGEIEEILEQRRYHVALNEFARAWQEGALRLKRNIGYMPGLVIHHWHGPKRRRGYEVRPDLIERVQFNPLRDIKRNAQGLYELTGENTALRDELRHYARLRNEDSTEL